MSLPNLLALLVLVIGVPLNLLVTWMLWRQSRAHPDLGVLRERLIASVAVLVLVVVFGLIFLNNDRLPPFLTTDTTRVVTRAVLFVVAVIPAVYWLILYRKSWRDASEIEERHEVRDAERDAVRDVERDTARDVARDVGRDAPRDLVRDTQVNEASNDDS